MAHVLALVKLAATVAVASSTSRSSARCDAGLSPLHDTTFIGFDINHCNVTVPTLAACCAVCGAHSQCAAFTTIPNATRFRCCTKTAGWQSARPARGYTSVVMPGMGPKPPPPPPPPYPTTATGITFATEDTALSGLWHHGETCEAANRCGFGESRPPCALRGLFEPRAIRILPASHR